MKNKNVIQDVSTMEPQFKNLVECTLAGYEKTPSLDYRGFRFHKNDTSGPHSFGYRYKLEIHPKIQFWDALFDSSLCCTNFGNSVTVWLTDELNRIRQKGSFVVVFSPETVAAAVKNAVAAIDRFYELNPNVQFELKKLSDKKIAAGNLKYAKKLAGNCDIANEALDNARGES